MIGELILAHFVGDYMLQSDWMASEKTKPGKAGWVPAILHALTYGLPFLFVTRSIFALFILVSTHAVIDHYRLARHLGWVKNQFVPRRYWTHWEDCKVTGYPPDKPVWMAVWLMIIVDNTIHMLINVAAVSWL